MVQTRLNEGKRRRGVRLIAMVLGETAHAGGLAWSRRRGSGKLQFDVVEQLARIKVWNAQTTLPLAAASILH